LKGPIICPYCGKEAEWVPDKSVYAKSYGGYVYACFKCDAFIGCHKQGEHKDPYGSLANASLRRLRVEAHALFDPLWKQAQRSRKWKKADARRKAYAWLAREMGISIMDCHIGMFRDNDVKRAIAICKAVYNKAKSKQAA
jgi:zinc-finger-containing domain